jgi:hypothetical protein
MTTLNDDLHLVLSWAQSTYPGTPSEVVDTQVYINFDFATAVCIGVEYHETGKVWYATATAWDRTGGVSDEKDIAAGHLPWVLQSVAKFLMDESVNQEKLERLLAQRPEEL